MDALIESIAMETFARKSINYLENMIDENQLPYFNVFWTDPAQAAHDWPDFADVMSRQLQAAIMCRVMSGDSVSTEETWLKKLISQIDPETGWLIRPKSKLYSEPGDPADSLLPLYTLVTAYAENGDQELAEHIRKMVDGLIDWYQKGENTTGFISGFGIKSAMACARYLDYEPAVKLSARMIQSIFYKTPLFSPDNTFRKGGHMHGNLRSLVGAADYALYVNDPVLYSRVDALYRYVRSEATTFGFLPEAIGRKGDIVSCETCAVMDYLGLAITLANHGHPEYWNDIERTARNQLIESQVTDGAWLVSDPDRADSEQFTWRSVGERMVGGYAGWSSPTHILAARETLNAHWGGPELRDKTRAFQNCCGGSGTHAFFEVWKNASRYENGCLTVNLHIDKCLPQAEIRGYQPFCGQVSIKIKERAKIKVRIPEFIHASEMRAELNGAYVDGKVWGNYLELEELQAGDEVNFRYPLPIYTEIVTIGNPGFQQYRYLVTWKGDTVIRMEPMGKTYLKGYSEYDKKEVPIYYGEKGPGRLYVRERFRGDIDPEKVNPAVLQIDKGILDFWNFGN